MPEAMPLKELKQGLRFSINKITFSRIGKQEGGKCNDDGY